MDFARKQLEKYGWNEGKGLGKNEDGIATPLKPKLKFDNAGVGHNASEQFTNNWWEKLFNNAAKNIDVEVDEENQIKMKVRLTESGIENYNVSPIKAPEPLSSFQVLTDDELFAACGGRTAHKGARHGIKLSGKLSRIEKQEKMLLKKMKKTVTKIYTVDLDTSFDSEIGSTRDENSNEPILENAASGSDEGIEQDIENNNKDLQDNHRSFEEAQFNINDLSKAERKKLKKKRKFDAKRNTPTGIFLQRLNDNDESNGDLDDRDVNLKKRKYLDDCEHGDFKRGHSKTESPERNASKKNKKKRKKQKKMEEKQINSIVKSLDNFCRISESE
ncbi:hypothetical protein NQ314_008781 [Rhamnusium bicolor]|uniref:G patch domain-containing protein 4 n=1 Tax=Rhamnusium bicolor TaxID=1586634 RepID=A0AAV8Y5P2_9CUCU|nr:hypothetical protein NQ314_008781 [Rhamnusium bicolor]